MLLSKPGFRIRLAVLATLALWLLALLPALAKADGWSGYLSVSASYVHEGDDLRDEFQSSASWRFTPDRVLFDSGPDDDWRRWHQIASFTGSHRRVLSHPEGGCGGGYTRDEVSAEGSGNTQFRFDIGDFGDFSSPVMNFEAVGPWRETSADFATDYMPGTETYYPCGGEEPLLFDSDQPPCQIQLIGPDAPAPEGVDTMTVSGLMVETSIGDAVDNSWDHCGYDPHEVDDPSLSGFSSWSSVLSYYLTRDPDPPECADGIDNDADSLIDYAGGAEFEGIRDPGCQSPTDDSEDSPPAKCNDGLDNDGDTLVDWAEDGSGDPGCSEADDDSELGTNACDNGTDDDGDGKTDWPADPDCAGATGTNEAENCLTSALGQRRRADLYFKGKVAAGGLPDAHLFDFKPFLTYCFGGGAPPEVISAATFGNIDYGADTAALELLGFTPEYNNESVTKTGNRATLTGNFDVRFDWLSILVRVGAAKAVKKVFDTKFTKAVDKLLKGDKEKAAQKKVLGALGKLEGKILAAYWRWSKAAYDASPAVLQGSMALLANWLYQRFEGKLAGYHDEAAAWVSSKALAKLTAKRLSAKLSGRLFAAFSGGSAFQVWTPVVNVEVLPSGELSVLDTGTANFLLTIDYSEQVTDIPVP